MKLLVSCVFEGQRQRWGATEHSETIDCLLVSGNQGAAKFAAGEERMRSTRSTRIRLSTEPQHKEKLVQAQARCRQDSPAAPTEIQPLPIITSN